MVNPLSVWRAKRAYEDFTGHKPTKEQWAQLDSNDVAGYGMGSLVGVAYEATRDGKTDQYFHRFSKKARPTLVARSDGKQLYITGGKYHVTDRGVEDMPQLFVVNPSKRRKRKARSSSTRARGRTKTGQFKKNPSPARRKRKATTAMAAPRRRRRARRSFRRNPAALPAMRRNPIRRRRRSRMSVRRATGRRYRRNPSSRMGGKGSINIAAMIMPGIMVGAGAVGAEMLMGYLPLPAMLTTGPTRYATKGLISVIAGWAIAKYINRKAGEAFAMGGIAIAVHDAIKAGLTTALPSAKFGEYMPGMSGYNWNKYGYTKPTMQSYPTGGLGYYSPGATMAYSEGMGEYMGTHI